eukprot:CAMPEP_0119310880 /NCGR_PEP_ID=MMETSP1333-20130426/20649_1 /TAXON_ID=418940 /ORGANISM="Scyphosphaera apsteinii, Strain RCC1455" /LENGTH=127 /DNA_ID=CAMNT_0007315143 /DNA_START=30 /DNA_END=413 /DNA_ORIENTATION=+
MLQRALAMSCHALTAHVPFSLGAAINRRGIITVNVQNPQRGALSGHQQFNEEIIRAEEIAAATFNRIVRQEIRFGSIPEGGRRMKRLSRYVKPAAVRRKENEHKAFRAYKTQLNTFMNWIQYRRRRA